MKRPMAAFLTQLLLALRSWFPRRVRIEAENLILRQQLVVLRRKPPRRARLWNIARFLFVWSYRLYPSLLDAIIIVQPEAVIGWHRRGFRAYGRSKSRHVGGRLRIDSEVRALIRRMSHETPLWGAPRIHGELLMRGIEAKGSDWGREGRHFRSSNTESSTGAAWRERRERVWKAVHIDYTAASGPRRVRDHLPAAKADRRLKSRFAEINVCFGLRGIRSVGLEDRAQVRLAEHDNLVNAFATNRSEIVVQRAHSATVRVVQYDGPNFYRTNAASVRRSECAVAVANQMTRRFCQRSQ